MNAYMTLADDGLAVDTELRVTTAEGEAIPGLWAAGSTGQGGLQLLNHGLHIGWAMATCADRGRARGPAGNLSGPAVGTMVSIFLAEAR
jgi:predicted oxidoreductase